MSPDLPVNRIRRLRIGRYQVLSHIATGGMGAVYKAEDVDSGREVALKVLSPEAAANPAMVARFRREAGHAQKLKHENIVTLYEWGQASGIYFLALEYIDGIDLFEYIQRKRQLNAEESRDLVIQAAKALAHLHQTGIVHRDIKPSNFLVTQKDGRPFLKLIDLGLARETNAEEFRLTRASHTLGTVDYMAPEQARDSGKADVRSDIYSLGCTWYHMLAGTAPFPKGSLTERIMQHSEAEPPDIRQFNPKVPPRAVGILRRMLAKDPTDRYQTPAALLGDLQAWERGEEELSPRDVLARLADPRAAPPEAVSHVRSKPVHVRKVTPRDEDVEEDVEEEPAAETEPEPDRRWLAWLWAGIAAAGCVGLVTIIVLLTSGSHQQPPRDNRPAEAVRTEPAPRPQPQTKDDRPAETVQIEPVPPPHPQPREERVADRARETKPDPVRTTQPAPAVKPKPAAPKPVVLRRLYEPRVPLNPEVLGQEFDRPKPPAVAEGAVLYRLSRFDHGGTGHYYPTLAAACVAAPPDRQTVIEIDDNGPLFELPAAVKDRSLVLRAGKGYRPLLAWDVLRSAPGSNTFLSVTKGNLALENLDVVCRCADSGQDRPSVLFRVADGFFSAKGCNFSVAGKHHAGVSAVRLEATVPDPGRWKCRLDRCCIRGSDLVALDLGAPGAEVLLNGCLVVGGRRPLVQVWNLDGSAPTNVRVVRSTLVAGQKLLSVQARPEVVSVGLRWHGWDALLACTGEEGAGEMVALADGTGIAAVQWEAVNCLYAGWQTLLKAKAGADLAGFRSLLGYSDGDAAKSSSWPLSPRPEPAVGVADDYNTAGTPVSYAATSGPGPLGCDLAALPPVRENWLRWSYERFIPAPLNLDTGDTVPAIPVVSDGLYHGEKLDLDRVDLGAYLENVQKNHKLGPRVVLHLSGTGVRPTSPVRVKGSSLVLYFQRGEGDRDEGTPALKPQEGGAPGRQALLEVEDGDLEIFGGRIEFPDFVPSPAYMLRVSGGHLLLSGCRLRAVPSQPGDSYRGLIAFAGSGRTRPERARGCVLNDCVLLSARNGLEVTGTGAQVRLTGCVLLAGTDAFRLAPGPAPKSRLNVQCVLEHNTVAAMRAAIYLLDAPGLDVPAEPVVVQAVANAFVDPFKESPGRAGVLLAEGNALGRGLVVWQGTDNVYGKRLHFYAWPRDRRVPADPQPYDDWARLWGGPGDLTRRVPLRAERTFALDSSQLYLLALPPLASPTPKTVPGADLKKLGLVKPKPQGPKR